MKVNKLPVTKRVITKELSNAVTTNNLKRRNQSFGEATDVCGFVRCSNKKN